MQGDNCPPPPFMPSLNDVPALESYATPISTRKQKNTLNNNNNNNNK